MYVLNTNHTYVQGNDVYSYLKTVEYHVKFELIDYFRCIVSPFNFWK